VYLRRSKADDGHQQFSLDVQREGSHIFVADALPRFALTASWADRVEYIDDDRAGDDFLGRRELQRLRDEVRTGDIVVCRDQSRLGRDALEVTLAVRELVQERGGRLFYYADGQEVPYAKAIDAAMTFVRGVGHQMELEAIRSRVREALRSRVRAGRIAGGRCFGYSLRREADSSGRPYTTAVVDPVQAEIVRRIFLMYAGGTGLKRIAISLNNEGIASPHAGIRGSGSWSPGAIRAMLHNHRYRGMYIHGRIKRVRRGGKRVAIQASPDEIISVDIPEWRIIDDSLWFAAQEGIRKPASQIKKPGPATRYPLSGIARCANCKGSIGAKNSRVSNGTHEKVYACNWHHERGSSVCTVTMRQAIGDVEWSLADYLVSTLLTEQVIEEIMADARGALEHQFKATAKDTSVLESELTRLRSEQRNLATAVATGGDAIPELVTELKRRNERIRLLEADVAAAKRSPQMAAEMLAQAEAGHGDQHEIERPSNVPSVAR
jgi:DNA invertase Pin-like site-specific DNA recombinase